MKSFSADDSRLKPALIIAGLFFVVAYIGIYFHELWRDEIQAWSIALGSHTISDLFYNSRYEGHPKLWFLLLFFLTRITDNIFYMQLLHILISALAVFIFVYFSPFRFAKNILICFGYFFAYEYSTTSRNYSIECLLLFLATGLFIMQGQRKLILISILLFLPMQTNIYAVIISIVFYAYIIFSLRNSVRPFPFLTLGSLCIFLTGLIVSVVSIIPPADSGYASSWNTEFNLAHFVASLNTVFTSYFPIPRMQRQFWNTNILDSIPKGTIVEFLLSLLILIAAGILFSKNKRVLLLYYSGTVALLLFTYAKYFGYSRHHGHLFLLFILCCLLYFSDKETIYSDKYTGGKLVSLVKKYFLNTVLLVQLMAFIIFFTGEIKYPFSNAKAAAIFLRPYISHSTIIAGDSDAPLSAIAGLLQKDFYYPITGRSGKYILWDSARRTKSEEEITSEINNLSLNSHKEVLAVFSYPLVKKPSNWILLNSFEGAIVYDENYFIYRISPQSKTSTD